MTTPEAPGPDRTEQPREDATAPQPLPHTTDAAPPAAAALPAPPRPAAAAPPAAAAVASRTTVRERVARRPWLALGLTAALAAGAAGGAGFAVGHAVGDDGWVHVERGGPPGWHDGPRWDPPALPEPRGRRGAEDQPDDASSRT